MTARMIDVYNNYGLDQPEELREKYHMNCAEVLLRTANAEYGLNLPEAAFDMMQGFGAGFNCGKTCGAFCGSLAALSAMFAEKRPSDQAKAKRAAKLLAEAFDKEFGSLDCEAIKEKYRDPVTKCNPVKERAWKVFTEVVAKVEAE